MDNSKMWYKSKTLWFNMVVAGLVALEASFSLFQPLLPVSVYAILTTLLAVGNAILRVVSSSKLIIKE